MLVEIQIIKKIKNNIPPTYKKLVIIFEQKWSKLKREEKQIGVCLFSLKRRNIMIESESTSSVPSKRKLRISLSNQSKLTSSNSLIIYDIPI